MRISWSHFTCRCSGGLRVPGQQAAGEWVILQATVSSALILQKPCIREGEGKRWPSNVP